MEIEVVYTYRNARVVKCSDGKYYPQLGTTTSFINGVGSYNYESIFLGYTDTFPRQAKYKSYKTLNPAKEYAKLSAEATYDYYRLSQEHRQQMQANEKACWYFNEAESTLLEVQPKNFLAFDPADVWKRVA